MRQREPALIAERRFSSIDAMILLADLLLSHAFDLKEAIPNNLRRYGKLDFSLTEKHSRQLAPGISFGVTTTDASAGTVNGWMWVMPDRRTIWVRNQSVQDPIFFTQDGNTRELLITGVTGNSVSGCLLLPRPDD